MLKPVDFSTAISNFRLEPIFSLSEQKWEEFFQDRYGALPREVLEAFDAYLNCGILLHGCARAYCEKCGHSELIAFSIPAEDFIRPAQSRTN